MKPALATFALGCVMLAAFRPAVAGQSAQALAAVAIVAVFGLMVAPRVSGLGSRVLAPFVPADPPKAPAIETPDVSEILREIEQSKGVLPPLVRRQLREIARGRLADHHRLSVDREADRAAIDELLSEPMRRIVRSDDGEQPNGRIGVRALPRLLDELEAL